MYDGKIPNDGPFPYDDDTKPYGQLLEEATDVTGIFQYASKLKLVSNLTSRRKWPGQRQPRLHTQQSTL